MREMTPLMAQYSELKSQYADAVLLFQMGDFFECFGDDAIEVSKILSIVLTKREKKSDAPPMAGFPIKALDDYLPKLVKSGKKVAIARQVELPSQAKGIVKRAVTDIITQGTIISQETLLVNAKNYLLALFREKGWTGIAFADISTGELKVYQQVIQDDELKSLLEKLAPREILVSSNETISKEIFPSQSVIQPISSKEFQWETINSALCSHFSVKNLDPLGLSGQRQAAIALGALLSYIHNTKQTHPLHLSTIEFWNPHEFLILDPSTIRNLDIFENQKSHTQEHSLIGTINTTQTQMGNRKLHEWLMFPLLNLERIQERQKCISFFLTFERNTKLRTLLKDIQDLERVTSLIALRRVHPRQLLSLLDSLKITTDILNEFKVNNLPSLLSTLISNIDRSRIADLTKTLEVSLANDVEEHLFAKGFSPELDQFIDLSENGHKRIKELFETEKQNAGIPNLKLGFNKVFGYYFETSHTHSASVPDHFIKKQTLVNNDRFITEEIKELEIKVLSSRERITQLEQELFIAFVISLEKYVNDLKALSQFIAFIDVFLSQALLAMKDNYTQPIFIEDSKDIVLKGSFHPIVSSHVDDFVPNSISIVPNQNFLILTGPNMGGKSTFIRQIALIQVMAQAGLFVPSSFAQLHIIDHIFARIGASDDIATGRSTFMVELSEVAYILRYATPKSLIILDEVGRGTSTYEGISLAWAISQYIAKKIKAITLFTTHFRELTLLAKEGPQFINYRVAIKEDKETVYFLHLIEPGISKKSYGIHVAQLVNLPAEIIEEAKTLLDSFEGNEQPIKHVARKASRQIPADQISFITSSPDEMAPIKEILSTIEIEKVTPLKAFSLLQTLIERLPRKEKP